MTNKYIPIHLPHQRVMQCQFLANMRSTKRKNNRFANHSDSMTNMIGLIGEAAFSQHFDIPQEMDMRQGGDPGFDFILRGWTVEVKSSDISQYQTRTANLLVRPLRAKAALYVLAWVDSSCWNDVVLVGYCTRHDLESAPQKDVGYGARYFMKHTDLTGFKYPT